MSDDKSKSAAGDAKAGATGAGSKPTDAANLTDKGKGAAGGAKPDATGGGAKGAG